MHQENQKVVLMMDNVLCHFDMTLSNVWLVFLPTNTTAETQPLDTGIIKDFKVKYCQIFSEHLFCCLEVDQDFDIEALLKKISVIHAVNWLYRA